MTTTRTRPPKQDEEEKMSQFLLPEEPLPPHTRQKIALDHIHIERETLLSTGVNKARIDGLKAGIRKIGLLQLPALEPIDWKPGWYRPVYGNRRTIALRQLGIPVHEFEVYAYPLTEEQRFAASQMENANRSMNWTHLVISLHEAIQRKEALTEKQLVSEYGFDKKEIGPYLKIAQLPTPLVKLIETQQLGKGLATRIATKLNKTQQLELASYAIQGTKIDEEEVDKVWRSSSSPSYDIALFEDMEDLRGLQKVTAQQVSSTFTPAQVADGLMLYKEHFPMEDQATLHYIANILRRVH